MLQKLLSETAIRCAPTLHISIERAERFLNRVTEFIRDSKGPLGDKPYLIIFAAKLAEGPALNDQIALENIRRDRTVFTVDEELHLIAATTGQIRVADCSRMTEQSHTIGIRVRRAYAQYFLCGMTIDEGDVLDPGAEEPPPSRWSRPMAEFERLLNDHKAQCIDREQEVVYWDDKSRRILLAGPDGTEMLFHRSLFHWLKMFTSDKLSLLAEPSDLGQNKTDILVSAMSGNYVVEVKWLGENENHTRYGRTRIDEGVIQVRCYLDNDEELVCGHLVIYDGRPLHAHQNESHYDTSQKHTRCKAPHILYLESETPSVASRRIARAGR